jgi:RNA polymerase sigma-70 factor, ECF subfamily
MKPIARSAAWPRAMTTRPDQGATDADEALVERSLEQPEAFGEIYRRYMPCVYGYLRARTASPDEAADLTQIVFLKAMASLQTYEPRRGAFVAWLFRIARNAAADADRRRRMAVSLDGLPEAFSETDAQSPEEAALRNERMERVRLLLLQLPSRKRELLALRFAAGLPSREIAAVLGKGEAAVKKELTRIIASLKEKYGDEFR